MSGQPRVWIVEMWNDEYERWEPTVGAALNRDDGRKKLTHWRSQNVSDHFRLCLYFAQGTRR